MDSTMLNVILVGIVETFEMVIVSTVLGYVLGLPLGIILTITDKNGLKPNAVVYKILDAVTNILRSVPFLILLVVLIPFTKLLVGKSYGTSGAIVPLTISAFPFIARMVESSLKEVDPGVIEAAQSMGATTWQIVKNVLLVEARTSLITGATIVFATIIGYSAMAGVVGAGGLGDIAVRYGYYRREEVPMWISVILLVILVEIFQNLGNFIAKRVDKKQ
jgi:D-methionine transport system permease protein